MSVVQEIAALERLIGRPMPAPLRDAVRMAACQDSILNEEEPGELHLFGVRRMRQEYLSFQEAWGAYSEGILPFGTVLRGSCRLGVDRSGRVLDLTPIVGGQPGWAVISPDMTTFLDQVERSGLFWITR